MLPSFRTLISLLLPIGLMRLGFFSFLGGGDSSSRAQTETTTTTTVNDRRVVADGGSTVVGDGSTVTMTDFGALAAAQQLAELAIVNTTQAATAGIKSSQDTAAEALDAATGNKSLLIAGGIAAAVALAAAFIFRKK